MADNLWEFDCEANDEAGSLHFEATATGTWSVPILTTTDKLYFQATATAFWAVNWVVDTPTVNFEATAKGDWGTEQLKRNWVKWSRVNYLDFTIGRDNIAGEAPMTWKGWVYGAKKLESRVIVYGQDGVSAMTPSGNAWGEQVIYRLGLKGKQAVCGDDNAHWFIDSEGQLVQVGNGIEILNYSEYLASLTNPVMSYDTETGFIYISDGTYGYVYSTRDRSLGTGPINITGIGTQAGTLYPVASATISTPVFEICTDIYDFGTHHYKTIFELEFEVNHTKTLQAAIDYRADWTGSFTTTSWKTVATRGAVFITALGREFRIRAKLSEYEWVKLGKIKIAGVVHDH